jgi:alpha-N-acetylglucosamine transferase
MNTKLLIKISLILIFTLIISIKLIKISNNYDESIDYLEENITISRNKNVLLSCKNQVEYEHDTSVWTLLTDDSNYALSAIKLIKSIEKNTNITKFDKIILEIKGKRLKKDMRRKLLDANWKICLVDKIAPRDEKSTFPRFRDQFTKLILWNMTEYKSIVYFDSDTFVIGNIDPLLQVYTKLDKYKIAVTKDIRAGLWQETFNMGVFSIKPNRTEFKRLVDLKNDFNFKFETTMSEQGFLNEVFKNQWFEFGFENNANLAVYSQQRNYWNEHESKINVIHYTMNKPWACSNEYMAVCNIWKQF